jgi:hypothetical protein
MPRHGEQRHLSYDDLGKPIQAGAHYCNVGLVYLDHDLLEGWRSHGFRGLACCRYFVPPEETAPGVWQMIGLIVEPLTPEQPVESSISLW